MNERANFIIIFRWNKKVEEAWLQLFKRIVYFMKVGYEEAERIAMLDNPTPSHENKDNKASVVNTR